MSTLELELPQTQGAGAAASTALRQLILMLTHFCNRLHTCQVPIRPSQAHSFPDKFSSPPPPTSASLSSARRRHLLRISPTAGPPSTRTISAVLPPSSETGSTCVTRVVNCRTWPAASRGNGSHCVLSWHTDLGNQEAVPRYRSANWSPASLAWLLPAGPLHPCSAARCNAHLPRY